MSELLKMLGCRYPIIQGPIGMFNSPQMVAAVSEAGAYGMLALGFINDMDEVKRLVAEVKKLTDKPFGANIMLINPANAEILKILAEAGVKAVTTSVGSPKDVYPIIHGLGMKGIHVVLALPHALAAVKAGADALVVVGSEAGGLRSRNPESSTMVLVPLVADHVSVPIVAAGGVADSRGYRAALALGAQGVQVGTRFLASQESPASEHWKKAIVECGDGGTDLIPALGMKVAQRIIVTPWIKERMSDPAVKNIADELDINPDQTGRYDRAAFGAGQVSALIKDIKPIKEIIREMVS
ncbi:MAG TPA: nitronate monooxygenase [Smithellaceae bacterium]|nr:nitronate monooxygenase [Smithellaceae bacterium]HRS89792.1 nitronate monooxygenase [Smithellaceae bacterium]HRV25130.1 nitronate monooxygenase [Smithellaceae bacterium]